MGTAIIDRSKPADGLKETHRTNKIDWLIRNK